MIELLCALILLSLVVSVFLGVCWLCYRAVCWITNVLPDPSAERAASWEDWEWQPEIREGRLALTPVAPAKPTAVVEIYEWQEGRHVLVGTRPDDAPEVIREPVLLRKPRRPLNATTSEGNGNASGDGTPLVT